MYGRGLHIFNEKRFYALRRLRPLARQIFTASASSAASERVCSMRPARSRLSRVFSLFLFRCYLNKLRACRQPGINLLLRNDFELFWCWLMVMSMDHVESEGLLPSLITLDNYNWWPWWRLAEFSKCAMSRLGHQNKCIGLVSILGVYVDWLTALRHISTERLLVPRNVAK